MSDQNQNAGVFAAGHAMDESPSTGPLVTEVPDDPEIPEHIQEELENPAPVGERHAQMLRIAGSLIRRGMGSQALFDRLRGMYAARGQNQVSDQEIRDIIAGVQGYARQSQDTRQGSWRPARLSPDKQRQNMEAFLGDFRCGEADLMARSPVPIHQHPLINAIRFLRILYKPDELINITWKFREGEDGRLAPRFGEIKTNEVWRQLMIDTKRVPQGKGGALIRLNPVNGFGIGNRDVVAWRFCLLEFDGLPPGLQLSFFAKIKLPIAAIMTSGGKSVHAWVMVNAPDQSTYCAIVGQLFNQLHPFGLDPSNKNSSRLGRFPGAIRVCGAIGDGLQRLLYLCPNPKPEAIYA
ncbi:MAG: hypothetical protein PHV34_17170 [Verrucomicrobiae bacterium]|nr:hypothetical protein [Verrucomicrobiae bacterium]